MTYVIILRIVKIVNFDNAKQEEKVRIMKGSHFRIVVGIKGELSKEDLVKLTPELRSAYSPCKDYIPGKSAWLHMQMFESFHFDQPDGSRKYAAFGIDFSGHSFGEFGVYSTTVIPDVSEENPLFREVKMRAWQVLKVECKLDAPVSTFILLGPSS